MRRLIFLFLIFWVTIKAQSQDFKSHSVVIKSLDSSYFKKVKPFTLVTTDSFIISSSYQIFISHIKNRIKKYDSPNDRMLLNEYDKTYDKTYDKIYDDGEVISPRLELIKQQLEYITVELIVKGKCLIFNRISNKLERKITSIRYVEKGYISKNRIENLSHKNVLDIITGFF